MIPSADENVDHLEVSYVVGGKQNGRILLKTLQKVLLQVSIHLPYDSAILLLGIYPRKRKNYVYTNPCPQVFITVLFKIAPTGNNRNFHQCVTR